MSMDEGFYLRRIWHSKDDIVKNKAYSLKNDYFESNFTKFKPYSMEKAENLLFYKGRFSNLTSDHLLIKMGLIVIPDAEFSFFTFQKLKSVSIPPRHADVHDAETKKIAAKLYNLADIRNYRPFISTMAFTPLNAGPGGSNVGRRSHAQRVANRASEISAFRQQQRDEIIQQQQALRLFNTRVRSSNQILRRNFTSNLIGLDEKRFEGHKKFSGSHLVVRAEQQEDYLLKNIQEKLSKSALGELIEDLKYFTGPGGEARGFVDRRAVEMERKGGIRAPLYIRRYVSTVTILQQISEITTHGSSPTYNKRYEALKDDLYDYSSQLLTDRDRAILQALAKHEDVLEYGLRERFFPSKIANSDLEIHLPPEGIIKMPKSLQDTGEARKPNTPANLDAVSKKKPKYKKTLSRSGRQLVS